MTAAPNEPTPVYGAAAEQYWNAGWRGILPVPAGSKRITATGWTGWAGSWPAWPDIQAWIDGQAGANLALRLPVDVLGVDVDAYGGKPGAATLEQCEARWGALPATWRTTSRDDGQSGIRLYRIPPGMDWPGQLPGGGVETVHTGHRYAVAWPSIHPEGRTYRWIGPDGQVQLGLPSADELPYLPAGWVLGLPRGRRGDQQPADLTGPEVTAWLRGIPGVLEQPCPHMARGASRAAERVASLAGSRHEDMLSAVLTLARYGEQGHRGLRDAVGQVERAFVTAATADKSRTPNEARGEVERALAGAVRVIAGAPSLAVDGADPCDLPRLLAAKKSPPIPEDGGEQCRNPTGSGEVAPDELEPDPFGTWPGPARSVQPDEPSTGIAPGPTTSGDAGLAGRTPPTLAEWGFTADRYGRLHPAVTLPELVTLTDFLAVPDEPTTYRIDRLLPIGGRAVLAAQYKAGKSTIVANLLRSLADGDPFLDEFEVTPPAGPVVLIDDELDPRQLRRWLRDQGIHNADQVRVLALRGQVSTFNLLDPDTAAAWVRQLKGAEFVIFDCLRPVLDACGLSEDKDAGRFLVAFDELLRAAGIDGAVLVHHMGHAGERSRGDSRLLDWPDATWRLVRQRPDNGDEPDPAAPRFFTAFGRDVDVPEGAVTFDPEVRRLSYVGGSRADAKVSADADAALPDLLAVLGAAEGPLNVREVQARMMSRGQSQRAARAALKSAGGAVLSVPGPRNAILYYLNPASTSLRQTGTYTQCQFGDLNATSGGLVCPVCGTPDQLGPDGICAAVDSTHIAARQTDKADPQ